MRLDVDNWGNEPPCETVDHWLDEALRAVPLPDGFFARLHRLADVPVERADENDYVGRRRELRGLSGGSRLGDAPLRGA